MVVNQMILVYFNIWFTLISPLLNLSLKYVSIEKLVTTYLGEFS